jgi:exodeoxyribonuclease VIII
VYSHKAAKALLEADGEIERSVFWTHQETGEACKARLDKLSPRKAFIADVKSTRDASPTAFAKSIVNYRYDVQADHYSEPMHGVRFVFIAVEKTPPYAVAVYAVNPEILALGRSRRAPNMRTYAECRATGRWPAYPETIQHITLPRWARA